MPLAGTGTALATLEPLSISDRKLLLMFGRQVALSSGSAAGW